jgi:hypothetical protein
LPNEQENSMAKKGSGKRDKDADIAVLDEIRKPGGSLDDVLPHVDWSADKDMFVRVDDWSNVDEMFAYDWSALDERLAYDWSALDERLAHDWSALDEMFAHLNDWSTVDTMVPADLMLDKLDGLLRPNDKPMDQRRPRRAGKRRPRRTDGKHYKIDHPERWGSGQ